MFRVISYFLSIFPFLYDIPFCNYTTISQLHKNLLTAIHIALCSVWDLIGEPNDLNNPTVSSRWGFTALLWHASFRILKCTAAVANSCAARNFACLVGCEGLDLRLNLKVKNHNPEGVGNYIRTNSLQLHCLRTLSLLPLRPAAYAAAAAAYCY